LGPDGFYRFWAVFLGTSRVEFGGQTAARFGVTGREIRGYGQ